MKNKIDISKGRYWQFGWQLIDGCTPCSPGCDNCWSAAMTHRVGKGGLTKFCGEFNGAIMVHPERLNRPLKRKKPAVYAIWNDLFHEDVPTTFIDDVFGVIAACPQHTFLILTKRAYLMEEKIYGNETVEYFVRMLGGGDYLPNAWWGLTICNQPEADAKMGDFLKVPGKKFLSVEPMLSEINLHLTDVVDNSGNAWGVRHNFINAVILGAETGPKARPMHPDWARSIKSQCEQAGVPFFLKSLGKGKGRELDGAEWGQLPFARGGAHISSNIRVSCQPCNRSKGARTLLGGVL